STTYSSVLWGLLRGARDRSSSPSRPASLYLLNHSYTVGRLTPYSLAAALILSPPSIRSTTSSRISTTVLTCSGNHPPAAPGMTKCVKHVPGHGCKGCPRVEPRPPHSTSARRTRFVPIRDRQVTHLTGFSMTAIATGDFDRDGRTYVVSARRKRE